MRFLADENFPVPATLHLRKKNYEVQSVFELMPAAKDELVIKYATENNLIVLTFDRDYGELIFKYSLKNPPAVIYFRSCKSYPTQPSEVLLQMIQDNVTFENTFTVIDINGIRQRKLLS